MVAEAMLSVQLLEEDLSRKREKARGKREAAAIG
jgi:hypothetical protein